MKTSVISDSSKTTITRTLKLQVDKFIVEETYINDKLTNQKWSIDGGFKITHPQAYSPQHMNFHYYEDIDFLNSDMCANMQKFHDLIPNPSLITNWDKFKGFDHVLCEYLTMDGNIYVINNPEQIILWRHQDYIGGFDNKYYNLSDVKSILETKDWIRNVKIIEIPYYNVEEGRDMAVEFEYKLPSKKHLKVLKNEPIFANHYFS